MNNNWILILGASSDIAIATAHKYAQNGYSIYLCSRNIEELKKEAKNIEIRHEVNVSVLYFDALDYESHKEFYSDLPVKPKGVLLAFGLLGEQGTQQKQFELAKSVIDTNYVSAVSILEVVSQDFEKRKSGFIVGISSVAGDRGRSSNYIYGSSKAGLSTYLQGLQHRLCKSNVHVLIVKPGFVATKMTADMNLPDPLTAKPNEVSSAIYMGIEKKKNVIYVKRIWWLIMLIIRKIPNFIFKRMSL
jgi:decaprenylphospho-beta-D-erythro-pentofuranosid-2-ulose 2-reductase